MAKDVGQLGQRVPKEQDEDLDETQPKVLDQGSEDYNAAFDAEVGLSDGVEPVSSELSSLALTVSDRMSECGDQARGGTSRLCDCATRPPPTHVTGYTTHLSAQVALHVM